MTISSSASDAESASFTVLWSTQSGHAKACARRSARIVSSENNMRMDRFCAFDDNEDLFAGMQATSTHSWLLLFVSTTGDGEQCDSIRETWRALRSKSLPRNLFSNVRFALFCLGDRAYGPQFCAAGRKLAARLVQLGAKPFCEVGFGDDGTPNGGVFADLDVWLEKTLLPAVHQYCDQRGISQAKHNEQLLLSESPYRVTATKRTQQTGNVNDTEEWKKEDYNRYYMDFFSSRCPITAYKYHDGTRLQYNESKSRISPLLGRMISNYRITAEDWEQDTRHLHIRVDISETKPQFSPEQDMGKADLPYQAGDVATILPWNTPEAVAKFLSVVPKNIQAMADDDLFIDPDPTCNNAPGDAQWPHRCTLRGLLTFCADICSLPEREDLRALSRFCQLGHPMGQNQKEKLLSLSETSGAALFGDYIIREKRCWADVLYDFDSICWEDDSSGHNNETTLSLEALLSILPSIQPRHFSIASAPSSSLIQNVHAPSKTGCFDVELCVAVVEGKTPLGRKYQGLCSNFLARQTPGSPVCLWVRPGSFGKLPLTLKQHSTAFETPALCIGAGTGIAPLRSILLEREAVRMIKSSSDRNQNDGNEEFPVDNILVFGCRKQKADYYYKDEWESMIGLNHLNVLTAFSRDQWHKIYVQQVIGKAEKTDSLITRHILERGGAVYIAGGAKMARVVKEELLESLSNVVGEKQANLVLKKMNRNGLYNVEAWS